MYTLDTWTALATGAAWLAGAIVAAFLVHRLLFALLRRFTKPGQVVRASLVERGAAPARLILPLLAAILVSPGLGLPPHAAEWLRHVLVIGEIAALMWLSIALSNVFQDVVAARFSMASSDNLTARKIQTQFQVLRRMLVATVVIIGAGLILMTFPMIHSFGATLFASAGLGALVAGMAARPALANLLAGVQIALTEPIRLEDAVIVEGEWGWIEEITTTYVVVRIWDLRRLIVPLSYFIEHPFQNWTRQTAELLGTVMLYVDYTVPVDEVRGELKRILDSTDLWTGKAWALQVTDAREQTVELRALMSGGNSGTTFDLRCLVRERLIAFLQERYPGSLPRTRMEVERLPANATAA
ncbi:MAG TPA: mechanosensitive ion channel family protein [Vicinamibacterales bacterium]|jgi:small-conductance mechanosensitive channel